MEKQTVYRGKVEPAKSNLAPLNSGNTEKKAPVSKTKPANLTPQALTAEEGKPLLSFHPDNLVQGFVFAEILGRPRSRRGR